jgi:hypothetical protein
MKRCLRCWLGWVALLASLAEMAAEGRAEEIWLHDNSRVYGMVRGVAKPRSLTVLEPTGEEKQVNLEEIVAIRFLGRNPLLVQSGTQEFRFVNGGRLRGQILGNQGDRLRVQTALAGEIDIHLAHLRGFVSLPLYGFSGRKAEEMIDGPGPRSPSLDLVLDRRGSAYPGTLRRLDRVQLDLDHDDLLQVVPIKMLYLAGVRLAEAGRMEPVSRPGELHLRLRARDDSVIQGVLEKIHLGKWHLRPAWDPETTLLVDVEEVALVQVLGGRVQYLSQLEPVQVSEATVLAPPQPYRMDRNCQGDVLRIGDKRYPWGIGVHARSELTFDLGGRFKEFRADIGLPASERGSVVFQVLGDGKELYKSTKVTGRSPGPIEVAVPVMNIQRLTLKVEDGGDLDLGDIANWGAARVLR